MTKVATISGRILSRKGTAQPMAATGPLARADVPAAIDRRVEANSWLPLTPPPAREPRRHDRDGLARGQAEPRVRVSLRLDRERHTRFKSICALVRRTQQGVLEQALDEFFARHGFDEAAGDRRRPIPERRRGTDPERDRR